MTTDVPTVAEIARIVSSYYPVDTAASWDRVGLTIGEPQAEVARVLLAVDCVAATVDEAQARGAQLMVVHHPLWLQGAHSVATSGYKGALAHRLIRHGIAVYTAHTNADLACPGVSDALADRIGLRDIVALPATPVRVGRLESPMTMRELANVLTQRLPRTTSGVRGAGDPDRLVRTVAVCGGAGDDMFAAVTAAGVDAYLTADLRHHPVSEHVEGGGPVLLEAAHWATERPWLDALAEQLRAAAAVEVFVSDMVTDAWRVLATQPASSKNLDLESGAGS